MLLHSRILCCLEDDSNILDLFLPSNSSPYPTKIFYLWVPPITLSPDPRQWKGNAFDTGVANWSYFFGFLWNDYCFSERDPLECAEFIIEAILSGMEGYIPYSFPSTKTNKPWLNFFCSTAIHHKWRGDYTHSNLKDIPPRSN